MHTPLALSVYYSRHDCAKTLLAAGADQTILDSARGPSGGPLPAAFFSETRLAQGGRTLLHYIVERNVSDLPMLRLLLDPSAGPIRPELDALNKQKETPLAAAFAWGNIPAGRELLAAGASLLPAGTSRTPLKMLAGYLSSGCAPTFPSKPVPVPA